MKCTRGGIKKLRGEGLKKLMTMPPPPPPAPKKILKRRPCFHAYFLTMSKLFYPQPYQISKKIQDRRTQLPIVLNASASPKMEIKMYFIYFLLF